jgi:putative colanic acid biosynthesis glycosyltransferase WcaI
MDDLKHSKDSVLIVSQQFFPSPIGVSPYITDLARWLREKGFMMRMITERPYYPHYRILDDYQRGQKDHESFFGIRVRRLPTFIPKRGRLVGRLLNELLFMMQACGLIMFGHVERGSRVVSVCPSILAVLVGLAATRKDGHHVALVYDIQSGLARGLGIAGSRWTGSFLRWVETFALNRADSVVVLCKRMEAVLRGQGVRKPIHVLPIWVDLSKVYPMTPRTDGPPTLLYSGNLGRKQGLEQLIDMAELLLKRGSNAKVVIRGAGTSIDTLRTTIQERCLRNVELKPLVPAQQLNEALAEGHVHLIQQLPEGADYALPSKTYGIMAAGRPFVCTAMPGSSLWSLVEETRAGLCVPPHDPEAFADAVISLIDDQQLCEAMGLRGRRYVEAHSERNLVLSSYLKLIAPADNERPKEDHSIPPALNLDLMSEPQ